MAVIDICSDPNVIVESGSIGFGFNPEMTLSYPRKLFDDAVSLDDIVVYRVSPTKVLYKGIVRRVSRSLSSDQVSVMCVAAETVLESKHWVPAHTAYNVEILCRNNLLNATIAQVIAAEYTNNFTGPQNWFTSVECPPSVAALIATPTETHQSSFLSVIQGVIASHTHVQWFIEYAPASTALLPIGKLVLVDTKIGRNAVSMAVGTKLTSLDVTEDGSNCAGVLNVYGGGDFVELEEVLVPAWNAADELIPVTMTHTAPLANDFTTQLMTYLPWGYDFTSEPVIKVMLNNELTTLVGGADYWFDPKCGAIIWNQLDASIPRTATSTAFQLRSGPPPDASWRRIAARHPDFFGSNLTITYTYCGPDCYRLYAVSEPIANLRLRLSRVSDPSSPGNFMEVATEQDPTVEAFRPVPVPDLTDPQYVVQSGYSVAKVLVPESQDVTWDERRPEFGSAKGFGIPISAPEFDEGRQCVRFADRQLVFSPPYVWYDLSQPPPTMLWRTWQIKLRYTAWRNLLEVRAGTSGSDFVGRFIFESLRKYTTTTAASQATAQVSLSGGSITAPVVVKAGYGYRDAPSVRIVGDGDNATAMAVLGASGEVTQIVITNAGSGYTQATVLIASSDGIIVNDSAKLAIAADEVRDFYGKPVWEGSASVIEDMLNTPPYKVTTLSVGLGDKVTLTGEVESALAAAFIGIVNQIDIASLESGQAQIGFGPQMPNRNPFEPKPPVFVDVERNGNLILDIYASQRRSS